MRWFLLCCNGNFICITTGAYKFSPQTDKLGRNVGREIWKDNAKLAAEYIYYRKAGDHATNMPSSVYFGKKKGDILSISESVKYKYDRMGNICRIDENGEPVVWYKYDALNRLVREDNKTFKKTWLYSYDNKGNILCKRETAFTLKENVEECEFTSVQYEYDGDKLLSFGTEACEYDDIGNPQKYREKNVTWSNGRQMTSYGGTAFTYDGLGRRLSKGNITYTYDGNNRIIKQSNGIEFIYDNSGVAGIIYSNGTYLYRKDGQGNICALIDSNGNVVVEYKYDAWGNHAVLDANGADINDASHIGNMNPYRYRSYYYDTETELYYLKSRYYDPETGRFITIDDISYLDPETINGLNLYAYCGNNPVMRIDENGNAWWDWLAWIGLGLFVAALTVVTAGMAGAVIGGIAGGIIYGAAIGTIALGTIGAVGGAVGGMIYDAIQGNSFGTSIWTGVKIGFGIGAIAGAIIGGAIGGAAASSVAGLTNTSFWTGLGQNGAQIAAKAAAEKGLITIGQTFGGRVVQFLTNRFGYAATKYLWISLSKTMASKVAMSSVTVFTGAIISPMSVFAMYEMPALIKRGIEIIRIILGG